LAFRLTGESFRGLLLLRAALKAAGVAAIAGAAIAVFGWTGWSALGVLATMGICAGVSDRHLIPFVGLALLAVASRNFSSRRPWLLAGAASAAGLFYSLDMGLILVGATLCTAAVLGATPSSRLASRRFAFSWIVIGMLAVAAPLTIVLGTKGALGAFLTA